MIVAAIIAAVFGAVTVTASTPAVRTPPPVTTPASASCPQWWGLAAQVGWPADQLPHMDRVMWCESNCRPDAYNRSSASGLMQVLARWFPDGADPFDPETNLTVALAVWEAQGWRAWSCR